MFLAAVPFTEVRLGEMSYVRPQLDCAVEQRIAGGAEPAEVNGLATGTAYDAPLGTISGEVGRIPIWWGFVHVVLQGGGGGGDRGDPLHGRRGAPHDDARQRHGRGSAVAQGAGGLHDRLPPPGRAPHVHRRGRRRLVRRAQPDGLRGLRILPRHARLLRWPLLAPGPAGVPAEPGSGRGAGGSHPTCREWWRDGANGLRARLLAEIDTLTRDEMVYDPNAILREENPGMSVAELEDLLLRRYLAHRSGDRIGVSSVSYEPGVAEHYRMGAASHDRALTGVVHATGDVIDDVLSMARRGSGCCCRGPETSPPGVAIREGMPIFLALLLMVFVAVLPVLMVFSRYDVSVLVTLTLVFFGLQFFHVLWGMAFWVDNHLYEALTGPAGAPKANPIQGLVSLWCSASSTSSSR